ncbi:hypothetical protein FANTH_13782 [Fusarium anthophilum]|uniref:Uncharacterized protein n=1 Tax=Fusarium anthophilum TaxID=48485 RepID=A0A8H4YLV6_9HYPO|nr:hypothetical protein FANTH_13782 [Fusarium anthophilum]
MTLTDDDVPALGTNEITPVDAESAQPSLYSLDGIQEKFSMDDADAWLANIVLNGGHDWLPDTAETDAGLHINDKPPEAHDQVGVQPQKPRDNRREVGARLRHHSWLDSQRIRGWVISVGNRASGTSTDRQDNPESSSHTQCHNRLTVMVEYREYESSSTTSTSRET